MKKFFIMFMFFTGCGIYLMNSNIERIEEKAKEISAPSPSKEIFGGEFHIFAIEKNISLSLSGNLGYSWNGKAKVYQNYEIGTETKFTNFQGFCEMGVVPLKGNIIFYPYFGIGGGIVSADLQGILNSIHIDYGYPAFTVGLKFLIPLQKKFYKKNFYPSFYLKTSYIFSFYEFFNGPQISFGYSLNVPPEGIIASILGGIIMIGGGR